MKHYRGLIPIALVVLFGLSGYQMFSAAIQAKTQLAGELEAARAAAQLSLTVDALGHYNNALALSPDPAVYVEVAEYYRTQGDLDNWINWCEDGLSAFPTNVPLYETLLEAYRSADDYTRCFEIIDTLRGRTLASQKAEDVFAEIRYKYTMEYNHYDAVSVFGGGYCAVRQDDLWGYINSSGEQAVNCRFSSARVFGDVGYAPVTQAEGDPYFIDAAGNKRIVIENLEAEQTKYIAFCPVVNGRFAAYDGTHYDYFNTQWQRCMGGYDRAGTFNGGVAAVCKDNAWQLIDADGNTLTAETYEDIKLDEKDICQRSGRVFAGKPGAYQLLDAAGIPVTETTFQDAKVFGNGPFAAVKQNDLWGFVNGAGEMVVQPQYKDARSFFNGLAAVQTEQGWGFVNESGEMVIQPQFYDAKDFSENGSVFVETENNWSLLRFYRNM